MNRAYLFIVFISFFYFKASAQTGAATDDVVLGLRITKGEKGSDHQWILTLPWGADIGVKVGEGGEVWGVTKSHGGHNQKLGEGILKTVLAHESTAIIETDSAVTSGNILFLNAKLPHNAHRSPYFRLVVYGIEITDQQGKAYYTPKEVFEKDGFPFRTQQFLRMQSEINNTGKQLLDRGDKTKVEAGPNRGKPLWEVMQQTDTLQVWYYVYHLAQMYETTMGQTIPLSDGYAAYAKEGDAASEAILKELFDLAPDTWDEKFDQYKRKLPLTWATARMNEAIALREKEELKAAQHQHDISIFIASKYQDNAVMAACLFEKAETTARGRDYEGAALGFEKARNIFLLLKNDLAVVKCDVKIGQALKNGNLLVESSVIFQRGLKLLPALRQHEDKRTCDAQLYNLNSGMADVHNQQKEYKKARETYAENAAISAEYNWSAGSGESNWGIARTLDYFEKNYAESIPYYEKSKQFYLQAADTINAFDGVEAKGVAFENLKEYQKAFVEFESGALLAAGPGLRNSKATFLKDQARALRKLGTPQPALKLLEQAQIIYRQLQDQPGERNTLNAKAELYQDMKNYAAATTCFLEKLPLLLDDEPTAQANVYWEIAYMNSEVQKDYLSAIANYKKSLALYSQSTDTTNWKTVLCNMGIVYQQANDSVNSYKTYQQAINLSLHNSDVENLNYVYQKAAETSGKLKNFRKKIFFLQKELSIYQKRGNEIKLGEINKSIGKIYEEELKEYKMADRFYLQAIEHYNKTDDLTARGDAYWTYAYNIGQNEMAFKEAIPIYELGYTMYIQAADSSNASIVRSNIGQTYWSMNDFDKAIQAHKEAIFLATRSGNQKQIFKSWNALADLYKSTLNPLASADALKNAVSAVEKLSDSTLLSSTYNELAGSYSKSKDYVQALTYYEKALLIRTAQKDSANIAASINAIGLMYHNKSEYVKAKEYYLRALDLRKKLNDRQSQLYILVDLGAITQFVDPNYSKAEAYFREAIQISKDFKDNYGLAYCYDRLNYMYRSEGKSALAIQYKQMAEDIYRKNNYGKELAELITMKGFDAFYYYGDQHKALQILDEAQAIQDTLKDKTIQAGIYDVRASVLREMGEFDKALDYTDKGMALYREVDNDWGVLGIYVVKGNIYKQRGEYETALRYQFKADSMYQKFNSEYSRYVTFTNIGENYAAQGDYVKALEYYQKANAIFIKANDQNDNVASIQGLIGVAYFYENNFAEADKWLKLSIVTSEKASSFRSLMDNLSSLGRLKIAEKKYDEAFKYLSQGLKLSQEKANTLTYLDNLVLMGKLEVERKNYEKAKGPLEESIKTSKAIGKNSTLWESLYLLGVLYKNTGDLVKSKEYLKQSVVVIEKIRNNVSGGADAQKLFSSDKNILNVYDALIEVLLARGETEEAMTYLQKNNEDNLRSKFKSLDMKFENDSKNKAMAEERNKKAKLDGIEEQIAAEKLLSAEKQNTEKLKNLEGIKTIAENEYLKFINQQINVQPELSKFFNNTVQPTQFRKIKKQIPKDMALVSYLAGENQLYIFAATTDTVIAKIITVSREQLTRDINAMLNIVKSSMGTFAGISLASEMTERKEIVMGMKQTDVSIKPFEDAYHYLIAPVSNEIAGKTRLCIIPTGALNYIPFQLLGKTLSNGKFSLLMNQFSIFYANSTDMLFREKNEDDKKYHILAFGNPDKSLPSTEKEVNDIKKMFPTASIFIREEATEDKAKYASESFNVMHFATHGNLDYEDFSKSYLTMAGNASKSEDGKLTLEELWGMEVMNHLNIVVLSACQTAVTKGSNESSPVSPASGFLQNGVKSVVATLWKVDDEATSMLMSDFYNNIKTMDAVDALRAAQVKLSLTEKFNHPYYWAAFVLMGDWR